MTCSGSTAPGSADGLHLRCPHLLPSNMAAWLGGVRHLSAWPGCELSGPSVKWHCDDADGVEQWCSRLEKCNNHAKSTFSALMQCRTWEECMRQHRRNHIHSTVHSIVMNSQSAIATQQFTMYRCIHPIKGRECALDKIRNCEILLTVQ